ncbi:MAG: hypothetical protein H7Z13_13920 [Ferruginibacter sp.]|nr:hypothetical protein [Ferruginibacter sp.]
MNKLRLIAAIAVLLTTSAQQLSAQFYFHDNNYYDTPLMYEIGGSFGIMNCLSDIGGRKGLGKPFVKDLNIGNNQLNGGIYFSALYKYAVGVRLEGTFGRVKSYDSILQSVSSTAQGRYERNLNFKSKVNEVTLIAEFHPVFIFINWLTRDNEPPRLSPYIAAGIGFFSFNPQGYVRNNWVDLQPLSTEGQGFDEYSGRKPYKLTGINIPLGVGFKYELSNTVNVRAEFLHRILSTDYLDDVSTRYIDANLFDKYFNGIKLQNAHELSRNDRFNPGGPTGKYNKTEGGIRGNPKDNDGYFTFNLKVGMAIGRELIRRHGPQRF